MRVKLQPPNAQDVFYLIKVEQFMRVVDSWDLEQRVSKKIENAYHLHWLSRCADGTCLFHAPEFCLQEGIARFINGRHRTLVLTKHLKEIPMALTNMDGYPVYATHPHQISVQVLEQISTQKLTGEEVFEFPDLPLRYLGYDDNIGK
jgi:hypothetical protein